MSTSGRLSGRVRTGGSTSAISNGDHTHESNLYTDRQEQQQHAAVEFALKMKEEANYRPWDLRGLPSDRSKTIERHPHSVLYSLHADTSKIQPSWLKLSHTAFEGS